MYVLLVVFKGYLHVDLQLMKTGFPVECWHPVPATHY